MNHIIYYCSYVCFGFGYLTLISAIFKVLQVILVFTGCPYLCFYISIASFFTLWKAVVNILLIQLFSDVCPANVIEAQVTVHGADVVCTAVLIPGTYNDKSHTIELVKHVSSIDCCLYIYILDNN